jgi:hypothetical protein
MRCDATLDRKWRAKVYDLSCPLSLQLLRKLFHTLCHISNFLQKPWLIVGFFQERHAFGLPILYSPAKYEWLQPGILLILIRPKGPHSILCELELGRMEFS